MFDKYISCVGDDSRSEEERKQLLDVYMAGRKKITKESLVYESEVWKDILKGDDANHTGSL